MENSNTLIIYNADSTTLALITEQLTANRADNQLAQAVHLKSFGRILAVFSTAEAAKAAYNPIKYAHPPIEVAFAGYTDLHAQPRYLTLPDAGTLWFTSPPLSPPEAWEQGIEEEPNKVTHTDTDFTNSLAKALEKVRESGPLMHSSENDHSCTIYQSPTDSLPDIRIDWQNCDKPSLPAAKNIPHTAMPEA